MITAGDLPAEIRQSAPLQEITSGAWNEIDETLPLAEAMTAFKRLRVRQALEKMGGNQSQAARFLGLQPSNLSRLLQTLGLR